MLTRTAASVVSETREGQTLVPLVQDDMRAALPDNDELRREAA
jgi:hypothetical protein